jgi:hypothetical protein
MSWSTLWESFKEALAERAAVQSIQEVNETINAPQPGPMTNKRGETIPTDPPGITDHPDSQTVSFEAGVPDAGSGGAYRESKLPPDLPIPQDLPPTKGGEGTFGTPQPDENQGALPDEDPPPPPPQKPDFMPEQVDPLPQSPWTKPDSMPEQVGPLPEYVEEPQPKPDFMPEGVGPLSEVEGPRPIKGEPPVPPHPVPVTGDPSLIDPNDEPGGVWVEESASGLTHEPGVWVDRPAIDEERLGAMIREQSGVTEYPGDVHQEPDLGGVPQPPGSADQQLHSLDLSSVYEEVHHKDSVLDSVYGEVQGATPPKVDPTQYPPDLPPSDGGEELADGNANGIPDEYGDGPDLDANGAPDEIGINPDSLQPGYPGSEPMRTPDAMQLDSTSTEGSYVTGLSSVTDDAYLTDPSFTEDPTTADPNDQDFGGGF